MGQVPTIVLPEGLRELQAILEAEWPARRTALHSTGVPLCEEDPKDPPDPTDPPKDNPKPPWGSDDDFDPNRAWTLIQGIRTDLDKIKGERDDLREKVKTFEDSSKSDQEKLNERASGAEQRAASAEREAARLRVALKKGLTETQAKRLVGENEEELEADADDLLASFGSTDDDEPGQGPQRRPTERLRPGAAPSSEVEETDPAKLAAMVPRHY